MQSGLYTISRKDLCDLFGRLAGKNRVLVPYAKGGRISFGEFDPGKEERIELGGIRQAEPLKSFLIGAREKVFNGAKRDERPVILAGVKACDLSSLKLQDFVFRNGETADPFYIEKRNNTTIIACDCTCAKETCFCMAMEGGPYPSHEFDLGLALADNYFLVEVGSAKGEAIVSGFRMFFKPATAHVKDIRDSARRQVESQIRHFIDKRGTPDTSKIRGAVSKHYDYSDFWKEMSSTCVECGACNLACPTCHCFLLFDERDRSGAKRFRIWDSCLYSTFARVAGGHNPRQHLHERLRNRFDKKFAFFPEVMDYFACTGCGRCIDSCAGDIDIREVLKGLVTGSWKKPPHE